MKLRHLRIERFRGIKHLDWFLEGDFICLIGPGDSCKSTILDAVELALSPRWNPIFEDSDFYDGCADDPIVIDATIGELPRHLISDAHFGLRLRGLTAEGELHDEPQEGDVEVVTIRLTVDSSLEPAWEVVTERHPEGAHINAREREKLGVVRLGTFLERHLSWSRGSALARLTGEVDEHAEMLADAHRKARNAVDKSKLPKLAAAAQETARLASAFGVKPRKGFEPALDPGANAVSAGGLALHDGPVPLRRAGLGTRRLVTLAVQRHLAREGGVVLVDEVEHALEPYRVRRLVRELLTPSGQTDGEHKPGETATPSRNGVVLMTSHSPIVLGELESEQLRVVRTSEGLTQILRPSGEVQPLFRTSPEAFLSRKIVVCEGKTELGLLRGLDAAWTKSGKPFAVEGVALTDGGGCTKVGGIARSFRELDYKTAVLADSDQPLDVSREILESEEIFVIQWDGGVATEERIFLDLPWVGVVEAAELAITEHGGDQVRQQLATALKISPKDIPVNVNSWRELKPEPELRRILGETAKLKAASWFKRVDRASALGEILVDYLGEIADTDLARKIDKVRNWIFDGQ
jgi:putative ATP-dependent endonuclease of OLD family